MLTGEEKDRGEMIISGGDGRVAGFIARIGLLMAPRPMLRAIAAGNPAVVARGHLEIVPIPEVVRPMLRVIAAGNPAVVAQGHREIAPIPKAVRPIPRVIAARNPAVVDRDLRETAPIQEAASGPRRNALIREAAIDVPNRDMSRPLNPKDGRKRIIRDLPNHRKVKPDNQAVSWR